VPPSTSQADKQVAGSPDALMQPTKHAVIPTQLVFAWHSVRSLQQKEPAHPWYGEPFRSESAGQSGGGLASVGGGGPPLEPEPPPELLEVVQSVLTQL
jgi:hypothetical protein